MRTYKVDVCLIGSGPGSQGSYYALRKSNPNLKIFWVERGDDNLKHPETQKIDGVGSGIKNEKLLKEVRSEEQLYCNDKKKSLYEPCIFGGGGELNGMVKFFCIKSDLEKWTGDFGYDNIKKKYDQITKDGFESELSLRSQYYDKIIKNVLETKKDSKQIDARFNNDKWLNKVGYQTSNVNKYNMKNEWVGERMSMLRTLVRPLIGDDYQKDVNTSIKTNCLAINAQFKKDFDGERYAVESVLFYDQKNSIYFKVEADYFILGAGVFASTRFLFRSGVGDFGNMPDYIDLKSENIEINSKIKINKILDNKHIGVVTDQIKIIDVVQPGNKPSDTSRFMFNFENTGLYFLFVVFWCIFYTTIAGYFNLFVLLPFVSQFSQLNIFHILMIASCECITFYILSFNFVWFFVTNFIFQLLQLIAFYSIKNVYGFPFHIVSLNYSENYVLFSIFYYVTINVGLLFIAFAREFISYNIGINGVNRPLSSAQYFDETYQIYFIPLAPGIIDGFPRIFTDAIQSETCRMIIRNTLEVFNFVFQLKYNILSNNFATLITTRLTESEGIYYYNKFSKKWSLDAGYLKSKKDLEGLILGLYENRKYLKGLYVFGVYPNVFQINFNQPYNSFKNDANVINFIKNTCSTTYHTVMTMRSGKNYGLNNEINDIKNDLKQIEIGGYVTDPTRGNALYGIKNLYGVGSPVFQSITSGSNQGICFVTGMITSEYILKDIKIN